MSACLLLTGKTEYVWRQRFFSLLGLTLLLNEATGAEPPPLASPLLRGHGLLAVQRLASKRHNVLGFAYSDQRGGATVAVSQIRPGAVGNVWMQTLPW